ncbi:MAG: hypothetical protein JNL50_12725 [Phycisphaerae bacterium]|nr:hypothetical protein [Phycisphaerae bacterium]
MQTSSPDAAEPSPNGLARLATPLPPGEVMGRVAEMSKRGKLPGFAQSSPGEFVAEAFATPFDHTLHCRVDAAPSGATLSFSLRMNRRLPWVYVLVLAVTIWPGVWVTDSMLKTYFSWYTIPTWWWYMPITVIPIPWMWRSFMRKSRTGADASARELIADIAAAVGARRLDQ